ncbi:hypothetical protein LMG27952_03109 [Paraburkholderia hiiakae]|uniref:Uncharacterized protein n=1 Tax=Paraburkholderia hiiakae TaxID=1081782 RepID=A0ABM8NP44_9BURK|nr:hypothetical protein [Paraburkholderia hiiakae]CAD6536124.1 hypothetical protein LMG27952_03109 [Paraburkholderia hiiakae]
METRLDAFNGWQMTASVETRPATGKSRYYIVPPLGYKESSTAKLIHPARFRYTATSFEDVEDAFEVAFGVCRRDIMNEIKLRNLHNVS